MNRSIKMLHRITKVVYRGDLQRLLAWVASSPRRASSSSSANNVLHNSFIEVIDWLIDWLTDWLIQRPEALASLRETSPLALSALGGCIWYLKRILLDRELITMKNFFRYDPAGSKNVETNNLVLDGQTLQNLEILENEHGTTEGTLFKYLDHTVTPFGSR